MGKKHDDGKRDDKKARKRNGKSKWPVHVAESPKHGRGLFASRDIPADAMIVPIKGKPATKDGIYVLWWVNEDGSDEGMRVTNKARFVNHSSDPNAAYCEDGVWSLRPIQKGEEITHHYGDAWLDVE